MHYPPQLSRKLSSATKKKNFSTQFFFLFINKTIFIFLIIEYRQNFRKGFLKKNKNSIDHYGEIKKWYIQNWFDNVNRQSDTIVCLQSSSRLQTSCEFDSKEKKRKIRSLSCFGPSAKINGES